MHVMHIALGGCLAPPPVRYGLTRDTGGHIAYVLGAARAEADLAEVSRVTLLTRAFDAPHLGADFARERQPIGEKIEIRRLWTKSRGYLDKERLDAEIPALTEAFLSVLAEEPHARPDVIHAHFSDAAILARAAHDAFGIPWVYTSHSLAMESVADPARLRADPSLAARIARESDAIRGAGAIVASSRDEAERQIPRYVPDAEGRTVQVDPGLTLPTLGTTGPGKRLLAPFLREPEKPILLAIARPIPKKNLLALIEAYAGSIELRARANLVILAGLRDGLTGDDSEQTGVIRALFDAVDRFDLWGQVALPRRHTADEVASLYALAAQGGVFCNPAHHEPFGLTLVEAACAGVPVVATRNGGPVDIVEKIGTGRLIDPKDRGALAEALLSELTDDLARKRARDAAPKVRAIFDWSVWAREVQDVRASLVMRTAPTPEPRRETLVASDIDATLTGSIPGAARFRSWAETRAPSVAFAVATGRSVSQARRVISQWNLPRPDVWITSCGSEIWRCSGTALTICEQYAATLQWDRNGVLSALTSLGVRFQARCEQRLWKLSCLGTAQEARGISGALADRGLGVRIVHSHGRFIDVMPPAAGKAAAIRFEARRLGLDAEGVIVAGDSGNDADMLQAFPRAILPSNAMAEIDDMPGYRSPLPHADGVLDGLVRYGLAPAARREGTHA